MSKMKFGKHIKAARNRRKCIQKNAASILGITAIHLSNLEKDKSTPSLELIESIHAYFGVNVYICAWRELRKANQL
jgi:transcriptional regulator with XRE-family HTH domain